MVNQPHEDSQDPEQFSMDSVLDQITDEIRDVEVSGDAVKVTTWNAELQKECDIEIYVLDSGESLIVDNPEDDEDPLPLGLDNAEMQNGYFRTREYVMFDLKRFALSKPVRVNPLHLTWLGSIEGAEELNVFGHRIRSRSNDIIWGGDYLKMAGQALGIIPKKKKGTPTKKDMLETLRVLKIIAGIREDQVNLTHKFKGFDPWKKKRKSKKNDAEKISDEPIRPEDVTVSDEEPIKIANEIIQDSEEGSDPNLPPAGPNEEVKSGKDDPRGNLVLLNNTNTEESDDEKGTPEAFQFGSEFYSDPTLVKRALKYFAENSGVEIQDLTSEDIHDIPIYSRGRVISTGGRYLDQGIPHFDEVRKFEEAVQRNNFWHPTEEYVLYTRGTLRNEVRQMVLERLIAIAMGKPYQKSDPPSKAANAESSQHHGENRNSTDTTRPAQSVPRSNVSTSPKLSPKKSGSGPWIGIKNTVDISHLLGSYEKGTASGNLIHNFLKMRSKMHAFLHKLGDAGSELSTAKSEPEKTARESAEKTKEVVNEDKKKEV